jgi:hypothetical protein
MRILRERARTTVRKEGGHAKEMCDEAYWYCQYPRGNGALQTTAVPEVV